ncbi:PilN domain-containing protein [Neobacillus drentensis]|uniref:PilN domain-containing protein n=1 Tax=Neobacillus drentensis TaxID=220684 RepID=UPI002FFDCB2E
MLVEINLLPQKEPKKFNIIYLSSIVAALVLIGGVYFWQIQSVKSDVEAVDSQIVATKKLADKQQQNANQAQVASSAGLLKSAVEWVKNYPIQTIPVMRHLTSLLPERGFIQSFAYTEAGTVTLSVQFDSAREAAYFLENLKESAWIADASLSSLSAVEKKETTAATAPTTGQNTATNTSSQNTATTATQNTANTNTAATTNQSTTASGQTSTTSTTASTTTNTATNSGSAATGTTAQPDKNILPRYLGQFEIKFNKDVIKTDLSKKKAEGGTGS